MIKHSERSEDPSFGMLFAVNAVGGLIYGYQTGATSARRSGVRARARCRRLAVRFGSRAVFVRAGSRQRPTFARGRCAETTAT